MAIGGTDVHRDSCTNSKFSRFFLTVGTSLRGYLASLLVQYAAIFSQQIRPLIFAQPLTLTLPKRVTRRWLVVLSAVSSSFFSTATTPANQRTPVGIYIIAYCGFRPLIRRINHSNAYHFDYFSFRFCTGALFSFLSCCRSGSQETLSDQVLPAHANGADGSHRLLSAPWPE